MALEIESNFGTDSLKVTGIQMIPSGVSELLVISAPRSTHGTELLPS
jgi:hypothetical protein